VTFDEHGGTYDHVPPPPAVPPDETGAPGQMGFTFNRSGVRIPTLAISAWIPEQTVVNDEFRATSLLATMRERFNLGQPLTARDASARSFADIFTLTSPRAQEDWPQATPRPVPQMHESLAPLDAPLGLLGKSLLLAVLAFAQGLGKTVPDIKPEDTITGAHAIALGHEILGDIFPAIATGPLSLFMQSGSSRADADDTRWSSKATAYYRPPGGRRAMRYRPEPAPFVWLSRRRGASSCALGQGWKADTGQQARDWRPPQA
jgi:Phosphoesterase family